MECFYCHSELPEHKGKCPIRPMLPAESVNDRELLQKRILDLEAELHYKNKDLILCQKKTHLQLKEIDRLQAINNHKGK